MEKKHISLWIDEEALKYCDANIKLGQAQNRSDYIEQAVDFYNGYIHGMRNDKYINKTIMKAFDSSLKSLERRLSRHMFKQAVEISKIFRILVKVLNVSPEFCDDIHEGCTQEVRRINGAISFPVQRGDED